MQNLRKNLTIWLGLIFISFSLGYLVRSQIFFLNLFKKFNFSASLASRALNGGGPELVNPLLDCGEIDSLNNPTVNGISTELEHYIAKAKKTGLVTEASVYFRDLNNGPWFAYNEEYEFYPGSLLKVPLLMSVLKKTESEPEFWESKIIFAGGDAGADEYFKPLKRVEQGKEYTVGELVKYMIQDSDNNAALLLAKVLGQSEIAKSYFELGIAMPRDGDYKTNARAYASFFRILYNASYLNRALSQKALQILTGTNFNQGLPAGVPSGTVIAHKFGERQFVSSNLKQLHDCGIVYSPKTDYALCVMTQGNNYDNLALFIKEVSQIIYNNVN